MEATQAAAGSGHALLHAELRRTFGHAAFRPNQFEAAQAVLERADSLVRGVVADAGPSQQQTSRGEAESNGLQHRSHLQATPPVPETSLHTH